MDLLEGETLDVLLERNGRLEALELLSLMDDLLDALAAAHAKCNGTKTQDCAAGSASKGVCSREPVDGGQ